jgi:hypothetical protein
MTMLRSALAAEDAVCFEEIVVTRRSAPGIPGCAHRHHGTRSKSLAEKASIAQISNHAEYQIERASRCRFVDDHQRFIRASVRATSL